MVKDEIYTISIVAAVALIGVAFILVQAGGNISLASNPTGQAYATANANANSYFCSDSDGGSNYSVQGIAYGYNVNSDNNYYYQDFCLNDGMTLIEYSCSNNHVFSEQYPCPTKCVNGRCT